MKQLNTFAADDLALCRSHSRAVDEHFIDPTTQEDLRRHTEYTNHWIAVSRFERGVHMPTDAPLPPTYDQDLAEWLAERDAAFAQRVREYVGVDPAKPGGDVTAVALVKSLGATGKAAPAAATHSVCIKAHRNLAGAMNRVGDVLEYEPASRHVPECWLPCDNAGWVSHTPTSDSACPVPAGVVAYEDRLENGAIGRAGDNHPMWHDRPTEGFRIIAWRPTGTAA